MATSNNAEVAQHGWTAIARDPQIVLSGKSNLHEPAPLLVKDIAFPGDDVLVAQVQAYAKSKLAPQTYNHSMRVYYFGECRPSAGVR